METMFFGIKNDINRQGMVIQIPASSVPKLDPVLTLHDYIKATAKDPLKTISMSAKLGTKEMSCGVSTIKKAKPQNPTINTNLNKVII